MFGIGFFELIIIAVVALVVVGPKRLPEVMKQAGRLFVHLRRTANDVRSSFEQVIREAEDEIRREEAESIRKSLQPVQELRQEIQGLLQDSGDAVEAVEHAKAEQPQVEQSQGNQTAPVAAPSPDHQPQGSHTFNPNGPGPLHKS